MKKVMLMMLTILSLQQAPANAGYASMAMGAFKAYAPKIAVGLGLSAAGAYADYQAKQFAAHADLKVTDLVGNLQSQFKQSADQANAHLDGGIKTVNDQLAETNKHIEQAAHAANNAVLVGAHAVDSVNKKMDQAAGLARMLLVTAIANPKVQHMFGMHITPAMYEALGLQALTPLKWYEKLWKGAVDLTAKTVNDTAMHIFSQMISNFMIGSVNRLVQSPQQQPQLPSHMAPGRVARQAAEEEDQAQRPANYRAAIRRRR